MRARTFTFGYGLQSPEWTGDVAQTVAVDVDGQVRVSSTMTDGAGSERFFDRPCGSIRPVKTRTGRTTYQYRYPTGNDYPGTDRSVQSAAMHAASYAASRIARSLAR